VRRRPRIGLLSLSVAAFLVVAIDAVGAGWWRRTAAILEVNPAAGVDRLTQGSLVELPETVRRSRRLVARDLAQADFEEVISALFRLGELQRGWFPADPIGFKNAARAAMLGGQANEADAWLDGAIYRDPTSPVLHRLAAWQEMGRGRRDQALDHLAEAYGLASSLRSPIVELTEEDERWVRNEGLRRALGLYPRQRVRTVLTLAEQLRKDGLEDRGRIALEGELPHPEVELALARWDRDGGDLIAANHRLQTITGRRIYPAPIRARAWALLAEVRDLDGDSAGAEAAAREALILDPRSTAPHLALARLAERRGDMEGSLRHLRAAWGLTPADPRLLVRIASTAEKTGEIADARLALERAVELEPDSAALAARLVDFHLRNGQYMEAALTLHRFGEKFPTDATLLRLAEKLQREVR